MRRPHQLGRQRGVAVITALLLTTLAVTIVASLFWQQQVQVRSMENQRLHLQTKWILRGALDWASLVLRQDGFDHAYTALDQVWATPLAETRLDQYIERERVQGEVFDATLSGSIIDATSRYNLRNLATNRQPDKVQVEIYKRLLQNLQIDPGLAVVTANAIGNAQPAIAAPPQDGSAAGSGDGSAAGGGGTEPSAGGGGGPPEGVGDGAAAPPQQPAARKPAQGGTAPVELMQVDDLLAIPGYSLKEVDKLREYVIVLPEPTPVNLNTASAQVLSALIEGMSVSEANSLVVRRKQAPWINMGSFTAASAGKTPEAGTADIKSEYFLVLSRVRLDRAALNAEALINRKFDRYKTTELRWVRQN